MAKKKRQGALGELVRTVGYALLIALAIRAFLFQPFNIPSSSMVPTLLIGDYLFVSKYTYGYSRHSFPFSPPLFSGRVFTDLPARGDVVVFKWPADNRTDYIKRVIGLPGDTVQMRDGRLYLNGEAVPRQRVDDLVYANRNGRIRQFAQYIETLPNGVSYRTLDMGLSPQADNTGEFRVPFGHLFVLGDNRDNSQDSRFATGVGFVPVENLVGKARILFFSTDGSAALWEFWRWPLAIRFDRILRTIDGDVEDY